MILRYIIPLLLTYSIVAQTAFPRMPESNKYNSLTGPCDGCDVKEIVDATSGGIQVHVDFQDTFKGKCYLSSETPEPPYSCKQDWGCAALLGFTLSGPPGADYISIDGNFPPTQAPSWPWVTALAFEANCNGADTHTLVCYSFDGETYTLVGVAIFVLYCYACDTQ